MEIENNTNNYQTGGNLFPYHKLFHFTAGNPPPTCISRLQFGLINPNFGPFLSQFGAVNSFLTGPVEFEMDPDVLMEIDVQRSMSLIRFMADEGLLPSPVDDIRRKNVIVKLKQIVMRWVKRVAYEHQLPKNRIRAASATISTYGSYGLGVHNLESDIDALCIAPYFATMAEDFFIILHNMLASRPEVTEIHCIKNAKVPLMRFKFDGVSIDLPFAQLKVISVPENVDLFNPFFLRNIDETSWKSLSGVRVNRSILRLVPNVELFRSLLRCLKLWAKRRGVYGHLLGYLGGVHLAVLVAFICQRHPNASLSSLTLVFFKTFAFWPWPTPVFLGRITSPIFPTDSRFLMMPIQLPGSPNQYCHSNITRSTFCRIRGEFVRGHALTEDTLRPDFCWRRLFEPFPMSKKYAQFVKITLLAPGRDELGEWMGWVKSRFRSLLIRLEELLGFCDPNGTECVDTDVAEPNVVFYWGLQPSKRVIDIDIDFIDEEFMKNIGNGYGSPHGKMKLSVIRASQLPKSVQCSSGSKGTKTRWRVLRKISVPTEELPQDFVENLANKGYADYPKS